ncbi:PLP-dependent aminotransferase family protein [Virgibacillus halophilus]|uniref:PLP-dependent aminotransferase family protein n=1 Tax=Tigheibacillus halophilus TaxID=361280 RepID=A0ABU5CAR6_9BACI|nr:PLP-dependent aminotransferase family protein [Virgibacillus halophilus]
MDMLSCVLDRESEQTLYEQLYRYIKGEIIAGRLVYETKLPSKRKLADYLKISENTIETAYVQLVAEGYLEAKPRQGYFIAANEDLVLVNTSKKTHQQKEKPVAWKYDFHPGKIDTEHFPFTKWRKYAKELIDPQYHHLLLHGDRQGELVLRQEIATYLYHARGVKCLPEEIIIGAGSEILLQQLVSLMGDDISYGVEDPGYHVISRILADQPNEVRPLQVDEDGVIVTDLEKQRINMMYTTPSNHFPYGYVLPVNRRVQLLNWASGQEGRYIIEDDYDSEFRYTGKSIPALKGMDSAGKVIYLGSFSKSLIPSLRISYMLLPNKLLKQYNQRYSYYHCTVSRIDQRILARFMMSGDFERHLNRMRKVYRRKLEKTMEILQPYSDRIRVIGEQNGLHILLEVMNGIGENELLERAASARINVYSLSSYSMTNWKVMRPKIVFGFAGIAEEELESALKDLFTSWEII